jgi:hypothetical protein
VLSRGYENTLGMSLQDFGIRFALVIAVVWCLGCGRSEPKNSPLPPVEIVTPTPQEKKKQAEASGHSRGAYLQRTEQIRTTHRAAVKRTPVSRQGLGRKVFQGKYEDLPEELAHRADLILVLIPDSEEVLLYEPADLDSL